MEGKRRAQETWMTFKAKVHNGFFASVLILRHAFRPARSLIEESGSEATPPIEDTISEHLRK